MNSASTSESGSDPLIGSDWKGVLMISIIFNSLEIFDIFFFDIYSTQLGGNLGGLT